MTRVATLVAALALPLATVANGGPVEVDVDAHGASGGLVPLQETTMSLVSERLETTVRDVSLGCRWSPHAEYTLSNPSGSPLGRLQPPTAADSAAPRCPT